MRRITIAVLVLLGCLNNPFLLSAQTRPSVENRSLALVGAKIYPSPADKPISNGIVLVKNGKIVAAGDKSNIRIPKRARIIDCASLVLTAGFWNSHVHFIEPKWQNAASLESSKLSAQIQQMLTRYGFAHVLETGSFDLENTIAIRRRIDSGEIVGPQILTSGVPFAPQGGSPFYIAPIKLPEISTPEGAVKYVRQQIASGADAIKLFAASPISLGRVVVMPLEIAKAAAAISHSLGKPVVAHPTTIAGVNVVLESGIDILAHTTPDRLEQWSDDLVTRLRSADVALVPTLKLWKWEAERKPVSAAVFEKFMGVALQQLRAYSQAGGEILFGTDVGYMTDYDPSDEYVYMAKAGLSFQQILAALTTAPAKRFGASGQTGRIAKGMDANIVLLAGDPAVDVRAFSNVKYTLRKGTFIYASR